MGRTIGSTKLAVLVVLVGACAGSPAGLEREGYALTAGDEARAFGIARYEVARLGDETVVRLLSGHGREIGSIVGAASEPYARVEMEIGGRDLTLQVEAGILEVFLAGGRIIHAAVGESEDAAFVDQASACPSELRDRVPPLRAVVDDPALMAVLHPLQGLEDLRFNVERAALLGCVGRRCASDGDCGIVCFCPTGKNKCELRTAPEPLLVDAAPVAASVEL